MSTNRSHKRTVQSSDTRPWSTTLREHWPILLIICALGPLTIFHASATFLWATLDGNRGSPTYIDAVRMGTLWILNSVVWTVLLIISSLLP